MKKLLRRTGTVLLFATVAICFAPTLVPIFLDRIYYRGPASDHYDGARFFNPGASRRSGPDGPPTRYMNRWLTGEGRTPWPRHVPVRQTRPPRRVVGDEMLVTWIGHATVLIQARGINILTDPMWSEVAAPFPPFGPHRVRVPGVRFEDLPKIDLVLVSHNHYDHLDVPTLKRLWARDRPAIVTGLGNDSILKSAGIESRRGDWGDKIGIFAGCPPTARCRPTAQIRLERVHHWSTRWGTDRNRALWSGFTILLPGGNIFFAGDTGWGDGSWVDEAASHGPIRLAILPIGAYQPREIMRSNHLDPDESLAAFERLRPGMALGIHWGTFQLTFEPINDPPRRLAAALRTRGVDPGRFVATEVGRTFRVPALGPPGQEVGAPRAGSGSEAGSRGSRSRRR